MTHECKSKCQEAVNVNHFRIIHINSKPNPLYKKCRNCEILLVSFASHCFCCGFSLSYTQRKKVYI